MANYFDAITPEQRALIEASHVFFVASAHSALEGGPDGQGGVNVSPKGNVALEMIDANQVAYLDYHGSGDETARHIASGGPVVVMLMSMGAQDAAIVRLYGRGRVEPVESSPIAERLVARCRDPKGLRQVIRIDVERTATSCGYGVPIYEYVADRAPSQRGRRYKS